uniref:CYRIA/CYRIB Rac1 binding domain-containing protein n=1 Tax=Glossina pallidipes TaxID=7398 RepID=A0A1A9Z3H8_GLOPL
MFCFNQNEQAMKTPAIQNDFSYYRRIVSRQRIDSTNNMLVSTELANRMSLFYAHATPMLKVLSEATSKFVHDNADDVENTTETLGTMAKVCLRMLENPKLLQQIEREETHLLVLRVMVGLVILYDHVHPVGAFARGAHVDVKGCVRLLQAQPAIKAEPLLNALRYTTKHLNEENTPKNIRNLLAA